MLKLLIVYTGETDLFEITNSIYQKVDQHSFHKGDCVIQSLNSKILVRAKKQNSETQFAHNPELKDKIVRSGISRAQNIIGKHIRIQATINKIIWRSYFGIIGDNRY